MNIIVLAGGLSTERDVSFSTEKTCAKRCVKGDIRQQCWMFFWDMKEMFQRTFCKK